MDRMRTRKPTFKSQPSMEPKATREEFKPAVDWTEDSSNRLLHMQLPGFKREDIKVQLDNAGKLLIKGSRQAPDNKYLDVDQSFDVPKDTITEKISGRFEDGHLTLIMPKKVVEEQEATRKAEGKEKEAIQEEKPYTAERKKEEEAFEDKKAEPFEEKPMRTEEKKDGPIREEKKVEPMKEKMWSHEEKKDEPMHEEKKSTTTEEKQDELSQKEKPKSEGEKKDYGPVLQEKPESAEERKDDAPTCKEKIEGGEKEKKSEKVEEKKKEDSAQTETTKSGAMEKEKEEEPIQLMKSKIKEICAGKTKDIKKRISAWKGAEDSWLDSGSFDGILEKLNRNRKVIAVAVVAFSVGFFVSQKLRTKGK